MYIRITITGEIPKEAFKKIKRLEHHIEYTGITENYPEITNIHVDVEEEKNI